jgi:hypothetical protein
MQCPARFFMLSLWIVLPATLFPFTRLPEARAVDLSVSSVERRYDKYARSTDTDGSAVYGYLTENGAGLGALPAQTVTSSAGGGWAEANGLAAAATLTELGPGHWRLGFEAHAKARHRSAMTVLTPSYGWAQTIIHLTAVLDLTALTQPATVLFTPVYSETGTGNSGTLDITAAPSGPTGAYTLADLDTAWELTFPAGASAALVLDLSTESKRYPGTYAYQTYTDEDAQTFSLDIAVTALPAVTTRAPLNITATSILARGRLDDPGVPHPASHGFVWSIGANPALPGDPCVNLGAKSVAGNFSHTLTGLAPLTTYTIRAYATNTPGTVYGGPASFRTPALPGDLNGVGGPTLADAILALQVLAGMSPAGLELTADVNSDGRLGGEEAVFVLQKAAALR